MLEAAFFLAGIAFTALIAYVFHRLQDRDPSVVYTAWGTASVRVHAVPKGDVEVRYRGRLVPHITLSCVTLWNRGRGTIDASHLVGHDALIFRFGTDSVVLSARILTVSRPKIGAEVSPHPEHANAVTLRFSFLDQEDGIVFTVVHTDAATMIPTLDATIKGLPDGAVRSQLTLSNASSTLLAGIMTLASCSWLAWTLAQQLWLHSLLPLLLTISALVLFRSSRRKQTLSVPAPLYVHPPPMSFHRNLRR